MAMSRSAFAWGVRVAILSAILFLNLTVSTSAGSGPCEMCGSCLTETGTYPCCSPVAGTGLCGNDDCHDDNNQCHYHGNTCCPS